ncbi:MAG TPA: hypothetical protein PKK26_03870 [Candidatus Wallbacteria bacterium]|nr:hypothetical protein [Candidatus Wallbacteria bacterium]
MNSIKNIIGYIWAVAAILLIIVIFIGSDFLSKKFVEASGLKVSPLYTGGETLRVVEKNGYKMTIQKPVFPALIGENADGFVQIVLRSETGFADVIEERIDYDGNAGDDFLIKIDTKKSAAEVSSCDGRPVSLIKLYSLKNGWAVRVRVKNERK